MNKQYPFKQMMLGTIILLVGAIGLCAQEPPAPPPPVPGSPGPDVFFFSRMEGASPAKDVKGSPYSAQAVTEMTQTLSDGNQIHHKTTATLYRDSEGRTRREQTLGGLGPWSAPNNKVPEIIRISDPVAGVSYVLNPDEHVAQKMPAMGGGRRGMFRARGARAGGPPPPEGGGRTFAFAVPPPGEGEDGPNVQFGVAGGGGPGFEWHSAEASEDVQTEALGSQVIEGVQAEGTRRTVTIPAGRIGNDKPIHVVTERWYSNQLQAVVLSKRSDPRVGETIYRLTNISQAEPAETLFQVPAGYTVRDAPPFRWESSDRKPKARQ
jgi:hypothetical protein